MKSKTLFQLASLSTSFYMMSKDEELMKKIDHFAREGKRHLAEFVVKKELGTDSDLIEQIIHNTVLLKAELEQRINAMVEVVYEKMKIAHVNEIARLEDELSALRKELAIAETRIVTLENSK